jgi:SAM-dependent methyltransferase
MIRKADGKMKEANLYNRFYLEEDHRQSPKEYFKFLARQAESHFRQNPGLEVADVGCAAGEFLFYLKTLYPDAVYTGIDVLEELLQTARARVPGCRFVQADLASRETLPAGRFDLVFMSGVHYLFRDFRQWVDSLVLLLKTGGTAYVFGCFNPEPLDVVIHARFSGEAADTVQVCLPSRQSLTAYLEGKGYSHCFLDWQISIPLEKKEGYPLRSWTMATETGYMIVNGLQLLHTFALLQINRLNGMQSR